MRDLSALLSASRAALPYRFLDVDPAALVSFCAADIAGNGTVLEAGGGIAVLADLPWETQLLGRRMGVLKYVLGDGAANELVERAVEWARERGLEFLLCKVYTDRHAVVHALTGHGFLLVETLLQYTFDYRRELPADPTRRVRHAEPADRDEVMRVSRAAFQGHVGRFHADPRFTNEEAVLVYEEWIRSSFAGYADQIFVAEEEGRIAGFSVWKDPSPAELAAGIRCAHYSLGAIDPPYRRRGLLYALNFAGMQHYLGRADFIDGPTNLLNLTLQRRYIPSGWLMQDSQYTFHKWID